jgi:hypothetical protein
MKVELGTELKAMKILISTSAFAEALRGDTWVQQTTLSGCYDEPGRDGATLPSPRI